MYICEIMRNTDIILLIPLVWGAFWGGYKGLISQIASLIGTIIIFYFSIKYYNPVAHILNAHIHNKLSQTYISIASFIILFLLLFMLVYLTSKQIEKLIKSLHMGFINHFAGVLFGLIKWAFIMSIVLCLINKFGQEINHTLIDFHNTWISNHIEMIAPGIMPGVLKGV